MACITWESCDVSPKHMTAAVEGNERVEGQRGNFMSRACGRPTLVGEGAFQAQYTWAAMVEERGTCSSPSETLATPGTCGCTAQQGGDSLWLGQAVGPHGAELAL